MQNTNDEQESVQEQQSVPEAPEQESVSEPVGLEQSLAQAREKAEENLKGWQRAVADFENYKRRDEEYHGQLIGFGQDQVIAQMLDITEDLDRVLANTPEDSEELQVWKKGVEGVHKRLGETLKTLGVEKVETVGKPFDHNVHEALMQAEGGESGVVAEEISPGYKRGERLLKPARVKVYKG